MNNNKRKLISSGSEFESKFGYSRAVIDGGLVYVAGTTGFDYENMTISKNIAEQAEQCFKNIEHTLLEAGSGLQNVVRIHYILTDRSDFETCLPAIKKYMSSIRPAATMFVAGLLDERMKIEIEVTATVSI